MDRCRDLPDLASRLLGGGVVACNDEFFAPADRLVEPSGGRSSRPHTFGAKGQVYDGWETRRRRSRVTTGRSSGSARPASCAASSSTPPGSPATSRRSPRSTACAVGGYPSPAEVVDATGSSCCRARRCAATRATRSRSTVTRPVSPTCGSTSTPTVGWPGCGCTASRCPTRRCCSVAWSTSPRWRTAAGWSDCSNMFYGSPNNMLLPGLARTMGEGWETARRRDDGNDWVLVRARPCPAPWSWSSWTRATSRATRPVRRR